MAENKEEESSKRVIYTYPMVKQTDMPDDMKVKLLETPIRYNLKCHFNRSLRISTTPNTTKNFLIIFKLTQQSIMVILSCLANQNLNSRKKNSVYY